MGCPGCSCKLSAEITISMNEYNRFVQIEMAAREAVYATKIGNTLKKLMKLRNAIECVTTTMDYPSPRG